MPDCAGFAPCVRWPPEFKLIPNIVSPGFISAKYTAPLACAPECGCTLAKLQLNNFFALSIAKASETSTCSQPP